MIICSCIGIVLFPFISLVQDFFERAIARKIASGNYQIAIHLVLFTITESTISIIFKISTILHFPRGFVLFVCLADTGEEVLDEDGSIV